jgi:hypothetical protein
MILFMSNAHHFAGMAISQAERENKGSPWSSIFCRQIFGFYVGIPTALRTAFVNTPKKCRAPFPATMTARTQAQTIASRPNSLTPWIRTSVYRTPRKDKIRAKGGHNQRPVGLYTVSTWSTRNTSPMSSIHSPEATSLSSHDETRTKTTCRLSPLSPPCQAYILLASGHTAPTSKRSRR